MIYTKLQNCWDIAVVFKTCQLHFLYFAKVEKDFMPNPLPPESVLFNVSFHTKTSNRMNNIESGEGGC